MIIEVVARTSGHTDVHEDEKVRLNSCVTCRPSASMGRVFRARNGGDLISFVGYAALKHALALYSLFSFQLVGMDPQITISEKTSIALLCL